MNILQRHIGFRKGTALFLLAVMLCLQGCAVPSFIPFIGSKPAESSSEESTEAEEKDPDSSLLDIHIGKYTYNMGDLPMQSEVNQAIKLVCGKELVYLSDNEKSVQPFAWAYTGFKIGRRYDYEFTLFNFLNDSQKAVSGAKTKMTVAALAYRDDADHSFSDQITYEYMPRDVTTADADKIIGKVLSAGGVLTYYLFAYDPNKRSEPTSKYPMETRVLKGTDGLINLQFKTISEQGQLFLIKMSLRDNELPDVAIINLDAEKVAREHCQWPVHDLEELKKLSK